MEDNSKKQNAKFLGKVISGAGTIESDNEAIIEARYKRFRQGGQITHFISNATPNQSFFIGTENGIEDIDCPPDHDNQGRDYLEDEVWASQPKPYDP